MTMATSFPRIFDMRLWESYIPPTTDANDDEIRAWAKYHYLHRIDRCHVILEGPDNDDYEIAVIEWNKPGAPVYRVDHL